MLHNHRTHREGEIVHSKDGWFMVVNGVDTAIPAPPAGVYFWEQDDSNPAFGWDYKKGDGINSQDTYFPGEVKYQKIVFEFNGKAIGIAITDDTDAQKKQELLAKAQEWANGMILLGSGYSAGGLANVAATRTLQEAGIIGGQIIRIAEAGVETGTVTSTRAASASTIDLLRDARVFGEGANAKIYVSPESLNKIGVAEAQGGSAFSGLAENVIQSKPATWQGQLTGGTQRIVQYNDAEGIKFIVHEVTDAAGFVVHRDFDAVRIASGQIINKMK